MFIVIQMYTLYLTVLFLATSHGLSMGNVWKLGSMKSTVRNWFIQRAQEAGISWTYIVAKYTDPYVMQTLERYKQTLENPAIHYPDYYVKPFHGYDVGNLEWQAAIECEAATYSISVGYWKNVHYQVASNWLRYNVTKCINAYRKAHQIDEPVETIVDIGCSVGISTECLVNAFRNAYVIGVDLSPYYLAVATHRGHQNGNPLHYVHANAENIPIDDETVNLVTVCFMFHEMPIDARKEVLCEAYRILKPNGVLAILDIDPIRIGKQLYNNPFRKWAFDTTEPHIHNYYKHDMQTSMMECGFDNIVEKENDPVNKVWIAKKNVPKIQPLTVPAPSPLFAMANV